MQTILLNHPQLVIVVFALVVGSAVALVAWLLSSSVAATPTENRQYKDTPPLGFRLGWLLIQWLSRIIPLSAKRQTAWQQRLRKAGLDYALRPEQFLAGRWLCAALVAALACWALHTFDAAGVARFKSATYLETGVIGMLLGWIYPTLWLKDKLKQRRNAMLKSLPFYLDIITLCVEAGLNLQGALNQAVEKGPKGVLLDEFRRVLRDIRAGKARVVSLRAMAERLGEASISNFISAVIQAEKMGMNLGPVLRAQADQRRMERFLRAEKLAMEAPVKLLFPLIAFIFPCTFIVLFFPLAMKFMQSGW